MTAWTTLAAPLDAASLTGTGAFRLMPNDPLAEAPASGAVRLEAQGWALALAYCWTHPTDGEADGILLVSSPEEDGTVRATLVDSWHQKPGPMHLRGTLDGDTIRLHATYMETWGWNIIVTIMADSVHLVMQNVVPEEALAMAPEGETFSAGPYDAMDLRLTRA